MGLFSHKPKLVSREQVIQWAANQYTRRAESLEAQQLFLLSGEAGIAPSEVMWKFLTSQWPIVVSETRQGMSGEGVESLFKDARAMEAAVRQAAPRMYPLTYSQHVEEVVTELRTVAEEEGWLLE